MGVMKFLVPRRDRLAPDAAERAYLAGLDEIPWHCRASWSEQTLVVQRNESDSGNFFIPCPIEGHGELTLSTACLMERERPYHLQVELARGTLHRLRNQLAAWTSSGMVPPAGIRAPIKAAHEHLSWAATRQEEAEAAADRALLATRLALDAMRLLSDAYVQQALSARHQQTGKLNTLWGFNAGGARVSEAVCRQLAPTFNTAMVPLVWRDIEPREGKRDWTSCDEKIEWCRAQGWKICSGPLLEIDKWSLPDWMYLWGAGEEDNFRSCVAEHVQAVVARYRGKVQLWQCAARLNTNNEFAHGEDERLRLAVLSVESIRRVDPRAPVIITVDQPWGAFMSREDCELSPLHFADALARADLGLAGIGLEINIGYAHGGTEPRDVLEFGRQMDRWSTLGLPLLISLSVPSSAEADPRARSTARAVNYAPSGELSAAAQCAWAEQYLPVLLAKQPVQAVIWNQLLDSQPHAFAYGGLFDAQDRPKPIVELLRTLRQTYLV